MERYQDPSAAVEDRVEDLLGRMTLDEKVAQLGGLWVTSLVSGDRFDADLAADRLRHGIGQVTRIGASTGLRPEGSASLLNAIQRVAVERTRLGIPVLVHEESTGGFCARDATVFPQGIGLASTFDPALVEQVAAVIRDQMLAVGARHTLAPVLDIARDPRWGRVEETYGEDPVLAGVIGTAYVQGLQTDDVAGGVLATGKHFLGYSASEGGRNHASVHLGPRELREVYAEPFAAAIRDAGLATVMNSYSSVDGLPCAGSAEILDDLLRGELGFDGAVVADYFSVVLLLAHHHTAADKGGAAAQALRAGMDVELPALDCYRELVPLVESGEVDLGLVDRSVRRVLSLKVRLGLFEDPYVDAGAAAAVYETPDQRVLARRAASESVVLLSNDGVLPLSPSVGTIAVVGPGADDQRLLQGDYHYPAHVEIVYEGGLDLARDRAPEGGGGVAYLPEGGGAFAPGPYFTHHVTPLAAIREVVPDVLHAIGCEVSGDDASGIDEAVALAERADVAVVVVAGRSGLRPVCTVGEARDATSLDLTGAQPELVRRVAATGTPTVVVVLSGRVHTLAEVVDQAGAVLQVWPPGEEGGNAVADSLFGTANPAGRLPVTLPRAVGQVPVHSGHRAGGDKSQFHGDYTDSPTSPLFPFGHGLSYTSFSYGLLEVRSGSTAEPVVASIEVLNTGDVAGDEVVQLYVSDLVASVARPIQQLVGFVRVGIDPGEVRTVTFTVQPSRLAFFDAGMRFVVEPGALAVRVGASSADLRGEQVVHLTGDVAEYRQRDVVATAVAVS